MDYRRLRSAYPTLKRAVAVRCNRLVAVIELSGTSSASVLLG